MFFQKGDPLSGAEDKQRLDDIDVGILRILQKQGRITNAKLASEVGLSAPPMLERVKKLERAGVIKGYRAILDARKLGRPFFVYAAIALQPQEMANMAQLEDALASMPEVLEMHHIAGDIDLLLKINVEDQESYKHFVTDRLARIKGLSRIQSWVVLSTGKDSAEFTISR